ncbi:hypothetical protein MBAV_001173, partial [Candidatus Magnetobacterium bavaricum]
MVCGTDYDGSVVGGGSVPIKYSVTDQGIVVLANDYTRVFGKSNIQVYTYDNHQGDDMFFMLYSYDEYDISSEWNINHCVRSYNFSRTYALIYKTPTQSGNPSIAQWTTDVAGGVPVGTIILYPSCQINRG